MLAVPRDPQVIEDDGDAPEPVRLQRPVALKVICPIPKNAVENFYDEAYREGIPGSDIFAATAVAQNWHRKWTQQDEEGHTMPESSNREGVIPEHYAYNPIDRQVGAKNPSPEDLQSEFERKRMRCSNFRSFSSVSCSVSDDDASSCSSDIPINLPLHKRSAREEYASGLVRPRPRGMTPPDDQGAPEHLETPQTGLVRPVALRVVRPAVIPEEEEEHMRTAIPQHILESLRHGYRDHQLSPLTVPSALSSCKSPKALRPIEMDATYCSVPSEISHPISQRSFINCLPKNVRRARCDLLHALAAAGGEVSQGAFDSCLEILSDYFVTLDVDTRPANSLRPTEGLWLTLTKPSYFGNLGDNDNGDPMYTLGRMAFDMFSPTNLVCSLQGNFNIVKQVPHEARADLLHSVPAALKEEVECCDTAFRTYE